MTLDGRLIGFSDSAAAYSRDGRFSAVGAKTAMISASREAGIDSQGLSHARQQMSSGFSFQEVPAHLPPIIREVP